MIIIALENNNYNNFKIHFLMSVEYESDETWFENFSPRVWQHFLMDNDKIRGFSKIIRNFNF